MGKGICAVDFLQFSVFIMNMEYNSAHICESSGSLMEDDMFMTGTDIIAGVDPSVMLGNFHREDLVFTDRLWTVMGIPQISSSSDLQYQLFGNNLDHHCRTKSNSAFRNYRNESGKEVQLCLGPTVKQQALKRCLDFLRRTYKNTRDESRWEANGGLVEESYAITHKLAERNRRTKLSQQFLALRSLVPHNHKKVDKISTLTNAISELNRQKLRIKELEQLNQSLSNTLIENTISEGCSSLSYGCAGDSRRDELMHCICEEVDIIVEKTSIPDEAIIEITLEKISPNCTHMEAIVRVDKSLREMELKVVRIQWRALDSENQLIEGTIRKKTMGGRWETKQIKTAVKHALTGS